MIRVMGLGYGVIVMEFRLGVRVMVRIRLGLRALTLYDSSKDDPSK